MEDSTTIYLFNFHYLVSLFVILFVIRFFFVGFIKVIEHEIFFETIQSSYYIGIKYYFNLFQAHNSVN